MPKLQVKRDTRIFLLWVIVLGAIAYSCVTEKLDWKHGIGYLVALGLPSFLGAKREKWSDTERLAKREKENGPS